MIDTQFPQWAGLPLELLDPAAVELAGFLAALQRFEPAQGAGADLTGRPLVARDRATRAAIAEVALRTPGRTVAGCRSRGPGRVRAGRSRPG